MSKISLKDIREFVEKKLELNISNKTRKRKYIDARSLYFKICRDFTLSTFEEIGETLRLNHATVIHGVKNIYPVASVYNKKIEETYDLFCLVYTGKYKENGEESLLVQNEKLKNKVDSLNLSINGLELIPVDPKNKIMSMIKNLNSDEQEVLYNKVAVFVKVIEAKRLW